MRLFADLNFDSKYWLVNKGDLIRKLNQLIKDCHASVKRMSDEDEGIPAIELGLLESKLIHLYDQVQVAKAELTVLADPVEDSKTEKSTKSTSISFQPEEPVEESSTARLEEKADAEIEEILSQVETLKEEIEKEPAKVESEAEVVEQEPPTPVVKPAPKPKPVEPKRKPKPEPVKPPVAEPKEEIVQASEPEPVETTNEPEKEADKTEQTSKPSQSINEKAGKQETMSLHEKLAARKEKQKEVSQRFSGRPITDIKKAIGLNQQVIYTKELFDNDKRAFRKAIDFVNRCKNFSEAKSYLQFEVMPKYSWNEENELYNNLLATIKRKFA